MSKKTLELMLRAERRDVSSQPMTEEEALFCGYSPTRANSEWSVVASVTEQIHMELACFNVADPMELYHEKEHYIDHPELLEEEAWEARTEASNR